MSGKHDDIYVGLRGQPDGNWYWVRSGHRFEHQGVNKSRGWDDHRPYGFGLCARFDLARKEIKSKGYLTDTSCSKSFDYGLCEIPYV